MILKILEWALGFALAWLTLRDVFHTVVVPGRSRGLLRISHRLTAVALPAWQRRSPGIGLSFAPLVLLASFGIWMALLVLAFGLMVHALRGWFTPALDGFGAALYLAGSSLSTIGFGSSEPHGPAAAVGVAAGFCGLASMTMAVTYLLEVQGNVAVRDSGVLKITTAAGDPPSALRLLERYAALGCRDEIDVTLRSARDWCAAVLQSHATHPSLTYFRSGGVHSGWPATLGAVMDLSLIIEHVLDEDRHLGLAVLVREEAERLGQELTQLLELDVSAPPATVGAADVAVLHSRLAAAGYRVKPDPSGFLAARRERAGCIEALARHLGAAGASLLPP